MNGTLALSSSSFTPTSSYVAVSTGCCEKFNKTDILSKQGQRYQMIKIMALTLIPIVALSALTSISVIDNVEARDIKTLVQEGILFSLQIGIVVHNVQIERGTSALYLSSGGDPFISESLKLKHEDTDEAISNLDNWPQWSTRDPSHFISKQHYFENIRAHRDKVLSYNVSLREAINQYSNDNAVIIGWVARSIRLAVGDNIWRPLVAYHLLLLAKDNAGVERALGGTFYAKGNFTPDELAWYVDKKVTAEHYIDLSSQYYDLITQILDREFTGSQLSVRLTEMRNQIINGGSTSFSSSSSLLWFENMTSYINLLKEIQDSVALSILDTLNNELNEVRNNLQLSIGLLCGAIFLYPSILFVVFKLTKQIQVVALSLKEQTFKLSRERKRSETLLCQMLPVSVAKKLMANEKVEPKMYQSATVFFSDIVGFTNICSACTPFEVVDLLNQLYQTFDSRLEEYDVYKVETIGDAYMVVSGVPESNGERHMSEISLLALDILEATGQLVIPHLAKEKRFKLNVRAGMHTGPVVAGVVGIKMPRYCLFGDTVNVASRMESTGKPQKIQMSATTGEGLQQMFPCFEIQERGMVEVKGKGKMKTYWLLQCKDQQETPRDRETNTHLSPLDPMTSMFSVQTPPSKQIPHVQLMKNGAPNQTMSFNERELVMQRYTPDDVISNNVTPETENHSSNRINQVHSSSSHVSTDSLKHIKINEPCEFLPSPSIF